MKTFLSCRNMLRKKNMTFRVIFTVHVLYNMCDATYYTQLVLLVVLQQFNSINFSAPLQCHKAMLRNILNNY